MRQGQEAEVEARQRTSCSFGNNVAGAGRLRSDVENPVPNRCSTLISGPCGREGNISAFAVLCECKVPGPLVEVHVHWQCAACVPIARRLKNVGEGRPIGSSASD